MARILLVVLVPTLTIFAVADWVSRSRTWTPGRVNRWVWLAVIVLIPVIGPLAWIITGIVTRAEQKNFGPPLAHPSQRASSRPDDDPQAISDLANRIARRERRSRPPRFTDNKPEEPNGPPKSKNEEEDEDEDRPNPPAN